MVEEIIRAIRRCHELLKEAKTRSPDSEGMLIPKRYFSSGPIKSESAVRYLDAKDIHVDVGLRENPYSARTVLLTHTLKPFSSDFKGKRFTVIFHGGYTGSPVATRVGVSARFFDVAKAMGYSIDTERIESLSDEYVVANLKWRGKVVAQLMKDYSSVSLHSKPSHVEKLIRALFTGQLPETARKQLSAPRPKI